MSTILADLGGTHLRLALAGSNKEPAKFRIADFPDMEGILYSFAPGAQSLYLSSAVMPENGMIEDRRFGDKSHWIIDLQKIKKQFSFKQITILNDLEAAAHALGAVNESHVEMLLTAKSGNLNFSHPIKLLIGIGTGIGHAFFHAIPDGQIVVQRTHGGHLPVMAYTEEHWQILKKIETVKPASRDLIMEDIISGHGFKNLMAIVSEQDSLRLFWEFLGLYCNMIVSTTGAYGGIYLTGGVIDDMKAKRQIDIQSFQKYFYRDMVASVTSHMNGVSVYYLKEKNLPLAGLQCLAGAGK